MNTSTAQNPLDQLHGIILPGPTVSAWPLAPGWWMLVGLLVLSVLLVLFLRPRWLERRRMRALRQTVRTMLDALDVQCLRENRTPASLQHYLQRCNDLFKRSVQQQPQLSRYASLSGKAWVDFIANINPHARYPALYGANLYAAECHESVDATELHGWAKATLAHLLEPDNAMLKRVGAVP